MLTDIDKYLAQVVINQWGVIIFIDIKILTYASKINKIMANLFSAFWKKITEI
jgi:hypothetical protein